jgi:hypothetical protein
MVVLYLGKLDTKNSPLKAENFLAGAAGIEPATRVLETLVIPLHQAPILFNF